MHDRNLAVLAERVYERRGDYPALWFEGRWHSSRELFEQAARLYLGVAPGDRVVLMAENSPDVPVLHGAIARAGPVPTPVFFLPTSEEPRRTVVAPAPAPTPAPTPPRSTEPRD